jgi:threonine aldolase
VTSSVRIDLYSDTKTRPTQAMRRAMLAAEVGDEQAGEDPTTLALEKRVATLLGKEAAVFLPSGTMCNQIALAVHCRPGDEVLADRTAHVVNSEAGGAAAIAGAQARTIDGTRGIFTAEQLKAALRMRMRISPRQRLAVIEQTANLTGGTVWPLATIEAVARAAREADLLLHMDGARLLNAAVATGISASTFAAAMDSVWIDLSKGLGCPVGAVLAGSRAFIDEAWRCKQRFGGAMRQSGMLAAAGLHALDHHVERLAEDHANARAFASVLAQIPGIDFSPDSVETNIVVFDVKDTGWTAAGLSQRLQEDGIRLSVIGPTILRAVTHLDVTRDGAMEAADKVAQLTRSGTGRQ